MSDEQDIQLKFGNLFDHADLIMKTAQEQQLLVAKLIEDAHERLRALAAFEANISERLAILDETPKKLGALAYKGGAEAAGQGVRAELSGLLTAIREATKEALTPALAPLNERTADANKAKDELAQQAQRFSLKALGAIGAGVVGAIVVIFFSSWASLAWHRSEHAELREGNAVLLNQNEEMKANAAKLSALGGKIEISDCPDSKTGKSRKCVAVQPTPNIAGYWGTAEKPFYVLKGY